MIKKIILWGVLVLLIVLAGGYFVRNSIVETAIEEGSTRALGVPTELGAARLGIWAGSLSLSDYQVSNPEGFESANLLVVEKGDLDVQTGSILDDRVIVDSLVLHGLHVFLEQVDNKGNWKAVVDHLKSRSFAESSESGDRKIAIRKIALRDIGVDARFVLAGETKLDKSYTVDNFTMDNIGGEQGATMDEIAALVVSDVLRRAAAEGRKELSGRLAEALGRLAGEHLEGVDEGIIEDIKDVGKSLLGGDDK